MKQCVGSKQSVAMLVTAAMVGAMSAPAFAGTMTESHVFDYHLDQTMDLAETFFPSFDTMGGTRELTNVFMHLRTDLSMTAIFQNYDAADYPAGSWESDIGHIALVAFAPIDGFDSPFAFMGGIFDTVTGDVSAGNGIPFPDGTPGDVSYTASISGSIESFLDTDPAFFGYFTSGGMLRTGFLPFLEILIFPPEGGGFGITPFFGDFSQTGSFTLTYEYQEVPAPATGALMIGAGAMALRRRRAG